MPANRQIVFVAYMDRPFFDLRAQPWMEPAFGSRRVAAVHADSLEFGDKVCFAGQFWDWSEWNFLKGLIKASNDDAQSMFFRQFFGH